MLPVGRFVTRPNGRVRAHGGVDIGRDSVPKADQPDLPSPDGPLLHDAADRALNLITLRRRHPSPAMGARKACPYTVRRGNGTGGRRTCMASGQEVEIVDRS